MYMKQLILLLLFIPTISISQVNKNNVVFKDGVEMNMNEFITICKNSANNVDGIEAYCLCFLEKIAYNYTSEEYISMSRESVMSSSNKIEQANTFWQNDKVKSITMQCIEENPQAAKSMEWTDDDKMIEVLAEQHLQQIKDLEGIDAYNEVSKVINLKPYSLCYAKKLLSEFKIKDLVNLTQRQILRIQEIQDECMMQNLK